MAMSHLLAVIHPLLAQAGDNVYNQPAPPSPVTGVIGLLIAVIGIVSMWIIFTKAGRPGWASIIPFYNLYVLCKVAGKSGWWMLLLLIPLVNLVAWIILSIDLAKNFGKGAGFGLGIAFLGFIFLPILAFGDARYQGAATNNNPALI